MIKHIVMLRFKPGHDKQDNMNTFRDLILELPNHIPVIRKLELGINYSKSHNASDQVLVTHFDTVEDLELYRLHPQHLTVLGYLKKVVSEVRVVDFNDLLSSDPSD